MENHRTNSIPNDSYPVKSDRLLGDRFPDLPDVRVEIVWDPPWSPELMSEESRRQLGML